jgi:hypothetical protein
MADADLSSELKAMATIEAALKDLPEDERTRVMQWAAARFKVAGKARVEGGEADDPSADRTSLEKYNDLASFYDAASPTDDGAKALVGAYWMQFKEGVSDVEAMTVNTRLKHLGHGVGNITRAFEALKAEKPSLIVQTRKEGSTKQARKKFKVTNEGKKRVEGMLGQAS